MCRDEHGLGSCRKSGRCPRKDCRRNVFTPLTMTISTLGSKTNEETSIETEKPLIAGTPPASISVTSAASVTSEPRSAA